VVTLSTGVITSEGLPDKSDQGHTLTRGYVHARPSDPCISMVSLTCTRLLMTMPTLGIENQKAVVSASWRISKPDWISRER
jgi:hypothetical protein